jgi:hypothetical protein
MSTAVAERAEAPTPSSETAAIIQVIERAASNPAVDMDKMERLLQMQERILNRNAEAAFNAGMTDAQADMGRISTDATNPQTRSNYATYGKLDAALRPIYTKHGFALSFDTGEGAPADYVRIVAHVSHSAGYTRSYHADMPADGKGAKGGDVMTKTHATGAAMSYGMRYLLKMIFNVAIGEQDRDGNEGGGVSISEDQLKKLQALADEVGGDVARLCQHFKIEALPDLPAAKLAEAVGIMELKRQRTAK